jgi:large subunit ribosomal protein L25
MTTTRKALKFYAKARTEKGNGASYRMRQEGMIPAVLYGREVNEMLAVDGKKAALLMKFLHGHNVIAELEIADNGNPRNVKTIVKEVQYEPLSRAVLHIDFYLIAAGQRVLLGVPLRFTGECPGVKEGGTLEHELWEIEIEGLPDVIPAELIVDLSALNIGDKLFVKDLPVPESVRVVTDASRIVVNVLAPKAVEEPVAAEEAAAATAEEAKEPEIITQEAAEERRKEKDSKKAEQSGS